MTRIVPALTPEPAERRAGFLDLPATRAAHDAALAEIPAFAEIEAHQPPAPAAEPGPLRIAAWNLERCLFPHESADLLRAEGASLVLLTEMDKGCHRTGQRDTTAMLAAALGMGHAFALEFLELATMPAPIAIEGNEPGNRLGFHGNGFASALPFEHPTVIRFAPEADWWVAPKGGQKRIGERMAVAAIFRHGAQRFLGCSVHLESRADFDGRERQMRALFDALDVLAEGLPIVVGGDLNTVVPAGGHEDAREHLFETGRARGYDWAACNAAGASTRPSTWAEGAGARQLDWFCTRGCRAEAPRMTAPLAPDGRVLSDHSLIGVTIRF